MHMVHSLHSMFIYSPHRRSFITKIIYLCVCVCVCVWVCVCAERMLSQNTNMHVCKHTDAACITMAWSDLHAYCVHMGPHERSICLVIRVCVCVFIAWLCSCPSCVQPNRLLILFLLIHILGHFPWFPDPLQSALKRVNSYHNLTEGDTLATDSTTSVWTGDCDRCPHWCFLISHTNVVVFFY